MLLLYILRNPNIRSPPTASANECRERLRSTSVAEESLVPLHRANTFPQRRGRSELRHEELAIMFRPKWLPGKLAEAPDDSMIREDHRLTAEDGPGGNHPR